MTKRFQMATVLMLLVCGAMVLAQSKLPRTPDGHPDLQGIWDYATVTPLERPKEFADKAFFTPSEAEEFERGAPDREIKGLSELEQKLNADLVGDFQTLDLGHLDPSLRTSLIIDPPDGKIPPLTAEAQARKDAHAASRKLPPDGPEALRLSERCLPIAPPVAPTSYNNILQIVQTADYLVIVTEMIHDARIVPLDRRSHAPRNIREWNGDSRGWWDGDTLVIDTTNFTSRASFETSTEALHLVERLTRIDERSLLYEFSVDDRTVFTRPWSGAFTMHESRAPMYEYACHEGNYSLPAMLRGARAQEQDPPVK